MAHSEPRVVVGLEFGTTFSGFSFAHLTKPDTVYTFYDYPKAGAENPYCKTLTASYYKNNGGTWQFRSWGYPARAEYAYDLRATLKHRKFGPSNDPLQPSVGSYFEKFKLYLASKDLGASTAQELPPGLTVNILITDYLRGMGALILKTLLEKYAGQLTKQDIQWCVTVPSIWDNVAKAVMKTCMTAAGLVDGVDGSRHPLTMLLEREAASFHCYKAMSDEQVLRVGEKLVVADIGDETSDIVVQEVVLVWQSGYRVRELTTSSRGLCGGSYVDKEFMEFLHRKIGPCLRECISQQHIYSQLVQAWEVAKTRFGDTATAGQSINIYLPNRVATKWEDYDRRMGIPEKDSYDELEVSYEEMQSIFDPVVEQNIQVIAQQLKQLKAQVRTLMVVGEFAGSPYLMDRIRARFVGSVSEIISPVAPGSAVCQGAVKLTLNLRDVILYRATESICEDYARESAIEDESSKSSLEDGAGESTMEDDSSKSSLEDNSSESVNEDVVKKYTWDEVSRSVYGPTSRELGRGGFGKVYLGKLESGKDVAVKILDLSSRQGMPEFLNEVNLLRRVNHVNLVRLLGYCQDEQRVLIFEFAEEGSLGDHLHGERKWLDWKQRLSIAVQSACGLEYLHTLCSPRIIHRDIKSENILLTKTMVAKVADFGASRLSAEQDNELKTHVTTKVMGTRGYLDPEYFQTGQLRESSDVYSFGIVLLEMVTGRKPVPNSDSKCLITNWVEKSYGSGGSRAVKAIADPSFLGEYNANALKLVINLARSCIKPSGESRPKISEVVLELRRAQALELEEKKSWFRFL